MLFSLSYRKMKTRRWIIFIALFLGFTTLVLYHGWHLIKVNEKIKNYLLLKIRPVLSDNFNFQELDMSIGAVHLKDVVVQFNKNYYSLHIEDIRLGFNFINLLKNGFQLKKIPQDIIFIKPHLFIRKNYQDSTQNSVVDSTLKDLDTDKYLKGIESIKFIKRITIAKGKISYIDTSNTEILLGNDINGWLSTKDMGYAQARLVGKIFKSKNYNLSMTGKMDLIRGHFDLVDIDVKNYEWNQEDSFFLPDYYKISQGKIDGTISLTEKKDATPGFNIYGNISIRNGAVKIKDKNLIFDDINLNTKIREWNCHITPSSIRLNGSPIEVSGTIFNILNPRLNLDLNSSTFDLGKFVNEFDDQHKTGIQGNSTISCKLTNTFENPSLTASFASDEIKLQDITFHNTKSELIFKNNRFLVQNMNTNVDGIQLQSSGQIDFNNPEPGIQATVIGSGNIFESLIKPPFDSLQNFMTHLELQANGDFNNLSGTLTINSGSQSNPDAAFFFNGTVNFKNRKLFIDLNEPNRFFAMTAELNLFKSKETSLIKLIGSHNLLQPFNEFKHFEKILNLRRSTLNFKIKKQKIIIDGDLQWNVEYQQLNRHANFICTIEEGKNHRRIFGDINLESAGSSFDGDFDIVKNDDYLLINNFRINNLFQSKGKITYQPDKDVEAEIVFNHSPLNEISRLIMRKPGYFEQGKLNGKIYIGGTLNNLIVDGNIGLNECIINGIGEYAGSTSFLMKDNNFILNNLHLKKNEQVILTSKGEINLESNTINLDFQGTDFELNETLTVLFNKSNLLSGKGKTGLTLTGKLSQPNISGTINIDQGQLSRFSFDRALIEFGENRADKMKNILEFQQDQKKGIHLNRILIVRNNQFEINGKGYIPYTEQDSVEITLLGKGNILSILPEVSSFFKETKGDASWGVRFTGNPSNLTASEGQIELKEGYLRLGDVAPKIKDLSMKVNLEQDGFLNVEYISGKIQNKPFTFRNHRRIESLKNERLEPFTIPALGLNFGIFTLETSASGVSLHIPALMKKREFGHFAFKGKTTQENFYFSGPVEKPYVRGKILLEDVNFTFPFIAENSANRDDDPVVGVLKTIEWDVTAQVGKNLHYQRQIPSGLDNVYLDLILDAGIGGLNFAGVLNENTFGVTGLLESSRGNVEYLNLNFQVLKAGAEFDMDVSHESDVEFDKSALLPIIYGEARTTVTDSTGFPYYIYLTLLTKDEDTGVAQKRGRLGEVTFQLSSENSTLGDSEGEILASLGYSLSNIKGMATDIIGISTDNLVFRPLFRPFERQLEQTLRLDMVRFSSRFTRNLIEMNVTEERNFVFDSKLFLLRSTKVMIGKYLADQLFLMYSGQLEAGMDYRYQHEGFGLSHKFGLEYRINSNLLLQMEYDYNTLMLDQREDKRVLLRHSFPF